MYSLDNSFIFDPTDLAEDVTPNAVHKALQNGTKPAMPSFLEWFGLHTP